MRIAITADCHLTTRVKHPERYQALSDIFKQCKEKKVQLLIIAGDLFDSTMANYAEFEELYKSLNEMGMPLFIHTGYDEWYGASFPPDDIEKIISSYPDMPVVLIHMVFPHIKRARQLIENYENVYGDATNVPGSISLARKVDSSLATKIQDDFIESV